MDYPPSAIDEVTFNRFVNLCSQDKIHKYFDTMEADFPRHFLSEFEVAYEKGNGGKHWTARAAWEYAAKKLLGGRSDLIHLLMISANRERQILRAAATAKVNNLDIKIETGYEVEEHELAKPLSMEGVVSALTEKKIPVPRIDVEVLLQNADKLFIALSDKKRNLMFSRQAYLDKLNLTASQVDIDQLEVAADRYEQDIYGAIGVKPLELNPWVSCYTELCLGHLISAVSGAILGYVWASLTKKEELVFENLPNMPRNKNLMDKLMTRRGFLSALAGAGLFAALGPVNSQVTPLTQTMLKSVRTANKDSIVDDWEDILKRIGSSQQILQINRENEDKIGI